jgi:hypothetical protein
VYLILIKKNVIQYISLKLNGYDILYKKCFFLGIKLISILLNALSNVGDGGKNAIIFRHILTFYSYETFCSGHISYLYYVKNYCLENQNLIT